MALLDQSGQEVGDKRQDGVEEALDNDKEAIDDQVQGADKATEGEDQGLEELENSIWKRVLARGQGERHRRFLGCWVTYRDRASR
jgi:hypothetical protein